MPRRRDPAVTSRTMARVRNKDSRAELALRRELHARGLRYRVHAADIFGRPDLVIRKWKFAVFVDGDMWHGNEHHRRGLSSLKELFPTNTDFWVSKITRNMERDRAVNAKLSADGWVVFRVWESEVLADPCGVGDRVMEALARAKGRDPHA